MGRVVGPYRVLDRLGAAGGPSLYVAEHLYLDRRVALRLIAPDAAWVSAGLDRFLGEARKLSRVKHDNVLGLVDLGETGDGYVYLALELPDGQTLDRVIAEHGPISGVRARSIGRQIGAALVTAGQASLLHRDLTVRDVFLTTRGKNDDLVKIDFANADLAAAEPIAASDGVRALGGLLYQMVVGQVPVADANKAPLDPILIRPDLEIPTDLDVLIMRALDPDPTKRWPDIESMLYVLAAAERRATAPGLDPEQLDGQAAGDSGTRTGLQLFGRTLFPRPSMGALIGCAVAVGVALILGIALIDVRRDRLSRGAFAVSVTRRPGAGPGVVGAGARQTTNDGSAVTATAVPGGSPDASLTASSGGSAVGILAPPVPTRGAVEVGGPRREAGGPFETKRGVVVDVGTAAVTAPQDDQAKTVVTSRASNGDDACAVTLGSKPWSQIWIDGKQAGFTPLIDYPVDCGPHELVFKSSESEIEKRVPIVVAAGQVFKKVVDLTGKTGASESAALGTGAAPAAGAGCLVTLGSKPWSEVWIDGKRLGVTPLVEYGISCAEHDVVFRRTDLGVERRETIVVQSDRTFKKVVTLPEAPTQ